MKNLKHLGLAGILAISLMSTSIASADTRNISGHWAESTIKEFMAKGYIGGYADGTFKPQGKITRAEAVSTLSRISNASHYVNKTILNDDIAKVNVLRKGKSEYGYYTLTVQITNKTNKAITLNTDDTYVNGKDTYSSCYLKIAPGKTITGDIEFNYNTIKSLNNFKDIHGYVKIFDSNTYKTLSEKLFEIK